MGVISFHGYFWALLIFSVILQAFMYNCPEDWMSYKQHCYKFYEHFLPWLEAEVVCKLSHGNSYLASISDEMEMDRINKWLLPIQISQPIWIGLNHFTGSKRRWSWSDMSTSNYKNWGNAEDANYNKNKNCVMMAYSKGVLKWYSENCSLPFNYLCKI